MDQSITRFINELGQKDELAVQVLWETYFERLVALAEKKMPSNIRSEGADDVAQEAFHSLVRGAQQGRFKQLASRDDLWQILVMLTYRKVARKIEREYADKRGAGKNRGESVFERIGRTNPHRGIAEVIETPPTTFDLAELAFHCEDLLTQLGDDQLRTVALRRLEGYTNAEIAEQLSFTSRWVERKVELIRKIWARYLET